MSIRDWVGKIKRQGETIHFSEDGSIIRWPRLRELYLAFVIILVGTLSFGLGMLSAPLAGEPLEIRYDPSLANPKNQGVDSSAAAVQALPSMNTSGQGSIIASSKSDKYHYSHCPGAKQISEANKITFASAAEAEAAGYTLAGNCRPR